MHAVDDLSFTPVGDDRPRQFTGRIVAATNRDLEVLLRNKEFRPDLYYRLKGLQLDVPPLRQRTTEIRVLAETYLNDAAEREGCVCKAFSADALKLLTDYDWPGNVRELRNAIDHAMAFSLSREIQADDIPISRTPPASGASELCVASSDSRSLGKSGQVVEIAELDRVLKENFYNRTRTAKQLGISRNALYKRIKKLGLSLGGS